MERDYEKHFLPSMTPSKQTPGSADAPPAANEPRADTIDSGKPCIDTPAVWRPIADRLSALIGEGGFCALLGRAIRTLSTRYDWLGTEPHSSIDASLASLQRDMAGADDASAMAANRELLQTFTAQLSRLIGEALTERLLKEAGAPPHGHEDGQEYQ